MFNHTLHPVGVPQKFFMKDIEVDRINNTLHSRHWMWILNKKDLPTPKNLKEFLIEAMPQIDPDSWNERFDWGGVYINGKPELPESFITPPAKVEYFEPKLPFPEYSKLFPPFYTDKYIIFEDRDLLIVFKPEGLPSKPAKEQNRFSLLKSLEEYAGQRLHMPSRLDVGTAGLVIVSKSRRAHDALQKMFERHDLRKSYLLEIAGEPKEERFVVDAPIGRDMRHPVLRKVVAEGAEGAKSAVTKFAKVYSKEAGHTIMLAEPQTGRTHQIRVHSVHLGFPLVGDPFYRGEEAQELHLLSYRLEFEHPFTKKKVSFCVPDELLPEWLNAEKLRGIVW